MSVTQDGRRGGVGRAAARPAERADTSPTHDALLEGPLDMDETPPGGRGREGAVEWDLLTRMSEKVRLYERDVYFREGLRDATRLWGPEWREVLRAAALVILKPDGLAAGSGQIVLDFLDRHGFQVIGVQPVSLAGHGWRAMWRYQLTAASTDRCLLNDLKYQLPGLALVLRDTRPGPCPAVVRLGRLKGPSDPARQGSTSLRALLQQPHRLFTYVHAPDEPADLLREVAVLTAADGQRAALLRKWRNDTVSVADRAELARALDPCGGRRGFDLSSALDRLERSLGSCDEPSKDLLLGEYHRMRSGESGWQAFLEAVEESGAALDRWTLLEAAATLIEMDDPDVAKAIGTPDEAAWSSMA